MRLLHTADLHLGKRLLALPLDADQRHILRQIVSAVRSLHVSAVLLSGDIFDRLSPPAAAVSLLDDFLVDLHAAGAQVFAVAGNHDSPERLDYAARLLSHDGIHIAGVVHGVAPTVTLHDGHGEVVFYLLPYVRPGNVRDAWPGVSSLTEGIRQALAGLDPSARNVLVTHQLALPAAAAAASPEPDAVDAALFSAFDYAALGHLHGAGRVALPEVRYAGAPLAYTTDEAGRVKSFTLIDLEEKGNVRVEEVPLEPLHPMRRTEGYLDEILQAEPFSEDYVHVRLLDDGPVLDAMKRLRGRFPNLVRLEWLAHAAPERTKRLERARREPLELYGEFFRLMNGRELSEDEERLLREAADEAAL